MKHAADLAAEFDRSFAEPAAVSEGRGTDALAIRAGGAAFIVHLSAITLVGRAPKIVPLPGGSPLQLGIAGIRGTVVTVLSLSALLGYGRGDRDANGWIATSAARRGVAIAFDALDGQFVLPSGETPPNLLDLTALLDRGGVAT